MAANGDEWRMLDRGVFDLTIIRSWMVFDSSWWKDCKILQSSNIIVEQFLFFSLNSEKSVLRRIETETRGSKELDCKMASRSNVGLLYVQEIYRLWPFCSAKGRPRSLW